MTNRLALLGIAVLLVSSPAAAEVRGEGFASDPTVVRMVQSPGAFEPQSLDLCPGRYIFMVTNQGVDHQVDFVLKRMKGRNAHGEADPRPMRSARLTRRVRNGGTSSTAVVDLKPGIYIYDSPSNKTPEYTLTVTGRRCRRPAQSS